MKPLTGVRRIAYDAAAEIARRPVCWIGFFLLPLTMSLLFATLMHNGLPTKIPAAIVDLDHSSMSRQLTQNISGMQMVDITHTAESYTVARHEMQRGEIFGYFLIPEDFEQDLISGRKPTISFYTNMTFYVPANLLFRSFKLTAVYTKAGVATELLENAGMDYVSVQPILLPLDIITRPLNNPTLNYAIYLSNSFLPCAFQLMIMLMTVYTLGQDLKYRFSLQNLRLAGGSVLKAVYAKLFPSTIIWLVEIFFMTSLLYRWCHFPMNGDWGWLLLSEFLFVLASQSMAIFIISVLPNPRLSLSVSALLGILSFSLAAYSFPVDSMYGAVGIFSWILPSRYNYLIYVDQALNGIDIFYSRYYYVAYLIFILLPLTMLRRLKRNMARPIYAP